MNKVFIHGSSGTTGLRIHERLAGRDDLELIILEDDKRKDSAYILDAMKEADVSFFCLPDDAAREAAKLAEGTGTVVIDTSTAHRTDPAWAYGFPELSGLRGRIAASKRIANPGCHASGFIALIAPLVENGLIEKDALLSCYSLTGYSGGGKKMIAEYENDSEAYKNRFLEGPRQYGLSQQHKHLKEMAAISGLSNMPAFAPIVADFYSGMEVSVPLFARDLKGNIADVRSIYADYYRSGSGAVHFEEAVDDGGFISASRLSGRDDMIVTVTGNDDRLVLISLFDNLGKGASGAAVQNMNLVLGIDEMKGLVF